MSRGFWFVGGPWHGRYVALPGIQQVVEVPVLPRGVTAVAEGDSSPLPILIYRYTPRRFLMRGLDPRAVVYVERGLTDEDAVYYLRDILNKAN